MAVPFSIDAKIPTPMTTMPMAVKEACAIGQAEGANRQHKLRAYEFPFS